MQIMVVSLYSSISTTKELNVNNLVFSVSLVGAIIVCVKTLN